MDELIDIVDAKGIPTGETCMKSIAHEKGLMHSSVNIWLINEKDQILVQKRGANVTISPNEWDVSVAGHIAAGETPINTAVREISEEIGLEVNRKDLHFASLFKGYTVYPDGLIDNGFCHIFIYKGNFEVEELTPQKEEVAELKLMRLEELEALIKEDNNAFVDRGDEYYSLAFKKIREFLTEKM